MDDLSELLGSSAEELKCLRADLHGKVEDSVIERLDGVILELELFQTGDTCQYDLFEILNLLGCAMELTPSIGKLIEYLMQLQR
jgi:hypothetical protein